MNGRSLSLHKVLHTGPANHRLLLAVAPSEGPGHAEGEEGGESEEERGNGRRGGRGHYFFIERVQVENVQHG